MIITDLALGFLIGLVLGLLGGGGSILTVPALVYVAGQSPQAAVTASLAIVGSNSLMGAYFHRNQGNLNGRVAVLFGGAGIGVAYLAAGISQNIAPAILMTAFAVLMLLVGALMILTPQPKPAETTPRWWVILLSGMGVGLLTGILGVGGGFLIVPVLVMLLGLPVQQAIGTSLVIIAMNSLAGFVGHLGEGHLDYTVLGLFLSAGLVGTLTGTRLACRCNPQQLRRMFAVMVIGLGAFLFVDNVSTLLG